MIFDADTIRSVVAHMNDDHQDACLLIVRAFSPYQSASNALLSSFDAHGLDMQIVDTDQSAHTIRINFDKALTRDSQIRGVLVAMTKKARSALE